MFLNVCFGAAADAPLLENMINKMYTAEDFNTENAPKEMVQYVIDNIEDFDDRYGRALYIMDRNRCPIYYADQKLYTEIIDCVDDWCNDNEDNSDLYDIEEIFC